MNKVEQFALKTIQKMFEAESKQAEKAAVRWQQEHEKEEDIEKKHELMNESYFSRGLACGYSMSAQTISGLIEANEQDAGSKR